MVIRSATIAILLGATALAPRSASAIELGIGTGVRSDLDDGSSGDPLLRFQAGPVLCAPLRIDLGNGVFVKSTLSLGLNAGQDRVEWKRFDGLVTVYSEDHMTLLSSASLVAGPELSVVDRQKLRVLWGVSGGVMGSQIWHSFDSRAIDVFDMEKNDLDNPMNIDPYTRQLSTVVGTAASVGIWLRPELALELEAGYNVSFLKEVSLRKADEKVEAVRSEMGLNLFRLGVSVIWRRGAGANK